MGDTANIVTCAATDAEHVLVARVEIAQQVQIHALSLQACHGGCASTGSAGCAAVCACLKPAAAWPDPCSSCVAYIQTAMPLVWMQGVMQVMRFGASQANRKRSGDPAVDPENP